MCGIFGYVGKKSNAAKIVFEGLKALEYRGYDSWGVAVLSNDKKIVVKKQAGKIGNNNVDDLPQGELSIGHTRWATHGGATDVNAHPHLDCKKNVVVIHNGIFENYEEAKNKLIAKGHIFISETDSEVVAHLIEEKIKTNSSLAAFIKTFNEMKGLNAVIVFLKNEKKLFIARNGSPLVIGISKNENFVASDPSALSLHTKSVYFLEDNQIAVLEKDRVKIFDAKTNKEIKFKTQKLDWKFDKEEKGQYPNFMIKEMNEQPKILFDIAANYSTNAEKSAKIIKKSYGTYFLGCGSASYVAQTGTYLFSKIAARHVNFCVGSEFGYQLGFLTPKSLVIAISQSGETMDILESVKKAKEKGAKIFALVNSLGSTLYREADYKTLIGAGTEKAVASTKAVTAQIAHLILFAYALNGKIKEGQKILNQSALSVKKILEKKQIEIIKKLANLLKDSKNMYIVGRGLSFPASLETAMKIKEISYIHAEGMAAGELKHGPLALIEKNTPCMVFLPHDETYGANLAAAMEMKARGGYIIGVSEKPHEIFDYFLRVDNAKEATVIPNIVAGQVLAYFLTMARGLDPDKPRNLAKSVTVK